MRKVIIISITLVSFVLSGNILSTEISNKKEVQDTYLDNLEEWDKNYEKTIEYIKEHEGFNNGVAYTCAAGYTTIGHGHVVKENEYFPERISLEYANKLVRRDFNKALELVELYSPHIEGNQKLAIAHFVFAKGIGNYIRSTLKTKIDNNESIDEEIVRWCHYKNSKGEKIRSEYSYKIRLWELEMYNSKKEEEV